MHQAMGMWSTGQGNSYSGIADQDLLKELIPTVLVGSAMAWLLRPLAKTSVIRL